MIILSAVAALVPVVVCYLGRWFLDRGRTEPPWIFPALSLLGGLGGILFALVIGPYIESLCGALTQSMAARLIAESMIHPSLEEVGKAAVLLPLLWTRWFRSPVDGLLYGFAAGTGFAVVENFLYFFVAFGNGGPGQWLGEVLHRLGPSIIIHGGTTGIVGAYLGAARLGRGFLYRGTLPLAGCLVAMTIHWGWNFCVSMSNERPDAYDQSLAYGLLVFLLA